MKTKYEGKEKKQVKWMTGLCRVETDMLGRKMDVYRKSSILVPIKHGG